MMVITITCSARDQRVSNHSITFQVIDALLKASYYRLHINTPCLSQCNVNLLFIVLFIGATHYATSTSTNDVSASAAALPRDHHVTTSTEFPNCQFSTFYCLPFRAAHVTRRPSTMTLMKRTLGRARKGLKLTGQQRPTWTQLNKSLFRFTIERRSPLDPTEPSIVRQLLCCRVV